MKRSPRRAFAMLLAASVLVAAPLVHAQAGNKAAAESLFQTGKTLMGEGKFDEACPKFVESQRLDPSVGTLLNLGRCYEGQGKTASAWAEYKEAAVLARSTGQQDRETAAKDLAAKLEPKLSKLRLDPAPGAADITGLEIKDNGASMGKGTLGIALAVDPGEHHIEVSAPGYLPWSTKITIGKEADSKTATIPVLEKDPNAKVTGPGTTGPGTTPPGGTTDGGGSSLKTAGFVVGGVGVVGIGLGAVFGILASGDVSSAEDDATLCPNKVCTPAGREQIDSASTKATVSTIGFAVGGAALAAGVLMILLAPSSTETAQHGKPGKSAYVLPTFDSNGGGVTLLGRF